MSSGHGHDNDKGHDHDHVHGLHTEDGAGPAVCSVQTEWTIDENKAIPQRTASMEKIMHAINAAAEAQGWLIGHIKAYIQTENEEFWFSSVGAGISRRSAAAAAETPAGICRAGLTVIVFGPEENTLCEMVNRQFDQATG